MGLWNPFWTGGSCSHSYYLISVLGPSEGFHRFPVTKDISGSHRPAGLTAASAFSS